MSVQIGAIAAPSTASSRSAWRALVAAAAAPYRPSGRHAWHFARAKLRGDPVFRHLIERGLIEPGARVLDIGCGQGLLASLLHAAGAAARAGRWPGDWAAAPVDAHVTGIDRLRHDVERGVAALGAHATFDCADMRSASFPAVDTVVIFDSLHYIAPDEQDDVLERSRAALRRGGSLLLRVGDAGSPRRFVFGLWVDRVTMFLRGGGFAPLAGRTIAQWAEALERLGFEVQAYPMSGRPPFVNQLLVGRVASEAPR